MNYLCNCLCGSEDLKRVYVQGSSGRGEIRLNPANQELLKFNANIFTNKVENFESPFRPIKSQKKNTTYDIYKMSEEDSNKIDTRYSKTPTKQRLSRVSFESIKTSIREGRETKSPSHWHKKGRLLCFFCGGEACKHENYLKNTNDNNAIIGLHSDFITDDIIASQRPSTVLINKYNLVKVFKEKKIGLIVNVQREGEHPYCGPNKKLEDSGFSYNPSQFAVEDIKVKLSGWKDMSVPETVTFILDVVKEMCVTIKEDNQKVLINLKT